MVSLKAQALWAVICACVAHDFGAATLGEQFHSYRYQHNFLDGRKMSRL